MIGTTEAEDNFLSLWAGRDSNHNLV
jgi:hypothetical protein